MPLPSDLRRGTCSELATLAFQRGLDCYAGLEVLTQREILWFTDKLRDGSENAGTCWLITDGSHKNAQARRLDGVQWQCIGGKKARTLRGWSASWPIGLADVCAHRRPAVLLVEGGPDILAGATLCWTYAAARLDEIGFAAVTGASNRLPPDALKFLSGHRVVIPYHADPEGLKAAARWETQLEETRAMVTSFEIRGLMRKDGQPAKDLNDAIHNPELLEIPELLLKDLR